MSDDTPDTNFKIIDTRSPETRARVAGDHVPDVTKMVKETLKPCPFCGSKLAVNDTRIMDVHFNDCRCKKRYYVNCSRCEGESRFFGTYSFATPEEAIAVANRRALEPMTSVVRWTRVDGTLETLPEDGKDVLVVLVDQTKFIPNRATVINFWPKISEWEFSRGNADIQKGDLWAYLPQPPEDNTNA